MILVFTSSHYILNSFITMGLPNNFGENLHYKVE
jgi:hypothetical protein